MGQTGSDHVVSPVLGSHKLRDRAAVEKIRDHAVELPPHVGVNDAGTVDMTPEDGGDYVI